jgi:putative addiction module component (TIGR02574 family)
MSDELELVEAQALKLSAEERVRLADRLIASLFDDSDVEEAWAVEVERRIQEIESGRAQLVPAADAIARARAAIKSPKSVERGFFSQLTAPIPSRRISV